MPFKDKEKQNKFIREWQKKRRDAWFVENGPCRQCGSWDRLEVDHVDPKDKSHILKAYHTGSALWSWSKERREEELAKCQPLCHSCHRHKTIESMRRPISHGSAGYARGCRCETCTEYQTKRMDRYHELHPRRKKILPG